MGIADKTDVVTRNLSVGSLIEPVDVSIGYKVPIQFRFSLKQFLGQE